MKRAYNYRNVLESDFRARKRRNAAYSLRAYAKSLGVSATMLSQIMSGKRNISKKAALLIAKRLKLSETQREKFLLSAIGDSGLAARSSKKHQLLDSDQFSLIADWYHFAILSLDSIPNHRWCPKWIAQRLEISAKEAKDAMDRLLRLGYVKVEGDSFRQVTPPLVAQSPMPSAAIQSYHKQTLQKATQSLSKHSLAERDFSSIITAVNPLKIDAARALIQKFQEDMQELLESGSANKRVYALNVQLFPISIK